jgi:dihydrofolate reductase
LLATQSSYTQDYAQIWQAANKVVYSKTLRKVSSSKTHIEQNFDPASIENLKLNSESDLSIGGPELATAAFRAGLVDECHMFVAPVVVGLGKKAMPFNFQLQLDLIEERRFGNGMVYLRYIIKG